MYFASFAFLPEKPCPTGTLVKRLSWMLINVGVSPNPAASSYLRHHPFFKRAASTLVSRHAAASAALAA
jgi:hypothetical protein